jgi:serine/threonine protein phosphatase PrpC
MKKVFQMEDQNICLCPFDDNLEVAFFAVFDGHVDKNAAIAAKEYFPQEFAQLWKVAERPITDAGQLLREAMSIVDKKMADFEYEGSTATVVVIWKENGKRYIQAANLGDSTAFLK